jgi:hypothetical protein
VEKEEEKQNKRRCVSVLLGLPLIGPLFAVCDRKRIQQKISSHPYNLPFRFGKSVPEFFY